MLQLLFIISILPFLLGYVTQRFGRKTVLIYASVLFTASWLLIAYAPTVAFIYAGRLLCGLSAGLCTVAVPAYVVEISTVEIRGLLTGCFQVAFALGMFLMTLLGIFLRWSWLAILGAVTVVIAANLIFFMPESPLWLIRNFRNAEAVRGIKFLKGNNHDVVKEFTELAEQFSDDSEDKFSFRELRKPNLYKPLLIAFGLMFNLNFCGFPAIVAYTVEVFQNAGSYIDPNIAATIVAAAQLIATAISSFLMDRVGRKPLYITSGICMTLSLVALGVYTYLSQNSDQIKSQWNWVPLLSFITYISTFSLGVGPMPYVIIPELVPTRSRSFVMAFGCFSGSLLGFFVTKSFDILRQSLELYGLYWLYGFFTFSGFVSFWIFVPETKGRTVSDINKSFYASDEVL